MIVQTHSGDEYETAPPPGRPRPGSTAPPPIEAADIAAGDPDFRFRIEPTPGERELRRLALDLGADVLINHHPHVLQGFESYHGKLIAHSLGNFIFDLYYPETMPTMVLTLEIEKTGITGYTLHARLDQPLDPRAGHRQPGPRDRRTAWPTTRGP